MGIERRRGDAGGAGVVDVELVRSGKGGARSRKRLSAGTAEWTTTRSRRAVALPHHHLAAGGVSAGVDGSYQFAGVAPRAEGWRYTGQRARVIFGKKTGRTATAV